MPETAVKHRTDFAVANAQYKFDQAQKRLERINKVVEDLQEEQRLYLFDFLNAQSELLEVLRYYSNKA